MTITIVRPPGDQRLEQLEDLLGRHGVQVPGGLVGHDDRRVVGERARDRRALLLAAEVDAGSLRAWSSMSTSSSRCIARS